METLNSASNFFQSKASAVIKGLQVKVAPQVKKTIEKGEKKILAVIKYLNESDEENETTEDRNTNSGIFNLLPIDLQKLIVLMLAVDDLFQLQQTCKSMYKLTNNQEIWKIMLERDRALWRCTVNIPKTKKKFSTQMNSLFSSLQEPQNTFNYKETYLRQYLANKEKDIQSPIIEENSSSNENISIQRQRGTFHSLFSKVYRIPIFGEGLEGLGKMLLYQLMWGKNPYFKVNSLYPGVEGIGSGVGFSINQKNLNLAAMHKYEDRGVFDKVRPLWKNFFKTASGFIFVCDTSDIVHAKEELKTFISDEWISNEAPILVLAYCDNPSTAPAHSIAKELGLSKERIWNLYCIDSNVESLDIVYQGICWLSANCK